MHRGLKLRRLDACFGKPIFFFIHSRQYSENVQLDSGASFLPTGTKGSKPRTTDLHPWLWGAVPVEKWTATPQRKSRAFTPRNSG